MTKPKEVKVETLKDIKAQIAELQQKANAIVSQERTAVIADILEKIQDYSITAKELGINTPAPVPVKKPIAQAIAEGTTKPPVAPKYQSKDGTKTWSGRGISPKWVSEHIAAGGSKDDLLIK